MTRLLTGHNVFELLGLDDMQRRDIMKLDVSDIERAYRQRSKQYHPDDARLSDDTNDGSKFFLPTDIREHIVKQWRD